jgi:mycothiol synthase
MSSIAALGLTLRRPTLDDLPAVVALYNLVDRLEFGSEDTDEAETRDFWREQDLEHDHWLVADAAGRPVAVAEVSSRAGVRFEVWVLVHPELRRRGIGAELGDLAERRAAELAERAPARGRVIAEGWVNARAEAGPAFARTRGYARSRTFWRMSIDLSDAPPEPPRWPEGITVRAFEPDGDARATWQAVGEAFADHWGHTPVGFEEWSKRLHGELFDPSLWFLAIDDVSGEIAGMALCSRYLDLGWVGSLGVRRPWRGRGLGEALLRQAFGAFHADGRRSVALGVDAESLTGATRLYERAGMHVDRVHELYTRVLREGTSDGEH